MSRNPCLLSSREFKCGCVTDFLLNIMPVTPPYSLWNLKKMCETEILALYQQLHTKHYIKRYKQQVYKFTKTTIAIRFNILQVFPSVPALCLCYFHVSLNLVAALTFSILLSKFRDSTAPCSLTTMRLGASFCSSLT